MKVSHRMFVYVIGSDDGPQKIGVSADTDGRHKTLQTSHPSPLRVHFRVQPEGFSALAVERMAHWILREHRLTGEWFGVTPDQAKAAILTAIENLQAGVEIPKAPPKERVARGPKKPSDGLWNHVATRLNEAERALLEAYRDRYGLSSLNGAVRHLIRSTKEKSA